MPLPIPSCRTAAEMISPSGPRQSTLTPRNTMRRHQQTQRSNGKYLLRWTVDVDTISFCARTSHMGVQYHNSPLTWANVARSISTNTSISLPKQVDGDSPAEEKAPCGLFPDRQSHLFLAARSHGLQHRDGRKSLLHRHVQVGLSTRMVDVVEPSLPWSYFWQQLSSRKSRYQSA